MELKTKWIIWLLSSQDESGTCKEFKAEGKDCIPMSNNELLSSLIPEEYKCGDVVKKGGTIRTVEGPG